MEIKMEEVSWGRSVCGGVKKYYISYVFFMVNWVLDDEYFFNFLVLVVVVFGIYFMIFFS